MVFRFSVPGCVTPNSMVAREFIHFTAPHPTKDHHHITTMTTSTNISILDHLLTLSHPTSEHEPLKKKFADPLPTHASAHDPIAPKPKPKTKTLSAKQKRKLGLLKLPPTEAAHWDLYAELRELWMGYAREVLFGSKEGWVPRDESGKERDRTGLAQELAAKVAAMEFSGAEVVVVRCRNVQRVGIRGTIVREGRGSFWICKREGGWAVLPKEGAVVRVGVEPPGGLKGGKRVVFDVMGDGIICRPADRANRKFKGRVVMD